MSEATDAFMTDFRAGTIVNKNTLPGIRSGRLWQNRVVVDASKTGPSAKLWEDHIHLNWIAALETRKGHGGAALRWLTDLADKHAVVVTLVVDPRKGNTISSAALTRFYKAHGFKGSGVKLTRQPQTPIAPRANPRRPALLDHDTLVQLAAAAQEVYDDWTVDEDGDSFDYGGGGICDAIAEAMQDVLKDFDTFSQNSEGTGENHTWVVLKGPDGVYVVDIPPGVYERGGGYAWTKILNVVFGPDDISVEKIENDPEAYEEMLGDG